MVFSTIFKSKKKEYRELAHHLYVNVVNRSREAVFYTEYKVPDTVEGRYDLLLIHLFLMLSALSSSKEHKDLQKALIDLCFEDLDQNLRQMGVGDMGVPRRIKKMAKAFNGRSTIYDEALTQNNDDLLKEALDRNLFVQTPDVSSETLSFFVNYMKGQKKHLSQFLFDRTDITRIDFAPIHSGF